jgi:heme exporter protein C
MRALLAATIVFGAAALAMVAFAVPNDKTGVVQRIFYFHLPLAWIAYLAFGVVLVASVAYLWKRDFRWDRVARASVEIGVLFTTLVLVTGSLWAKPIWGGWWTWDSRLTSTLVLWFIYVGYLMLRAYTPDPERAARFSAVLGIVGFIDIPIVHFAVQWWPRGMHPEAIVARENPQLEPIMLTTLLVSLVAMTLLYATLLSYRTALERLRDENRELEQATPERPALGADSRPVVTAMEGPNA